MMPPAKIYVYQNLWMWPYLEKKVIADIIQLRISGLDHSCLFMWGLNIMIVILIKQKKRRQESKSEIQRRRLCEDTQDKAMWRQRQIQMLNHRLQTDTHFYQENMFFTFLYTKKRVHISSSIIKLPSFS